MTIDDPTPTRNTTPLVSASTTYDAAQPWNGRPQVNLAIAMEPDAWEPTGPEDDPTARLELSGGRLTINGLGMHVEAWAVGTNEDGVQVGFGYENDLEHLAAIYETAFATTTIGAREYVIVAYPHSA